uniref:Inositol hexakisphosphate and diphosphoinositol-pentakisphosphate kinase n=1 Tax=Eucampia antarctica TaxID=49252 RepID=A0A7S2W8B8_9STRA
MEYAADLPINTMGRRIRTRLYFTSESHLHTLLNVFRFPSKDQDGKTLLSRRGSEIISSSLELCYLTQVIIRLFENTKKEINDPRRFRIEISFSPGATAAPEHMAELDRDYDSSRFDTEPLQLISKDNLTCEEVEKYFTQSIREGKTDEDDEITSSVDRKTVKPVNNETQDTTDVKVAKPITSAIKKHVNNHGKDDGDVKLSSNSIEEKNTSGIEVTKIETKPVNIAEGKNAKIEAPSVSMVESPKSRHLAIPDDSVDNGDAEDEKIERMARILAQKYFWSSIAAASFFLGVGCLVLSRGFKDGDRSRRWSKR